MNDVAFYTHFFEHTTDPKKHQFCVQVWTGRQQITYRFRNSVSQKEFIKTLSEYCGPKEPELAIKNV